MARIRSIKPEFPQSETVGKLSRDARLLFIQLWTIVDDAGRARAASRMLASLLYPYDDDAPGLIEGWLGELERAGNIRRYEIEGKAYLDIPKWLEHQKIDRPSASRLPEFSEGSKKPRECSRALDADLGPRTLDQDLGSGSKKKDAANAAPSAQPSIVEPPEKTAYFQRVRSVLGANSGGVGKQLLEAKDGNIALARAAIEQASATGAGAREYVYAIIHKRTARSGEASNYVDPRL